jgi:hypothetical protein
MQANSFVIAVQISITIPNTTIMKDKIEELLKDYSDREARASLAFFLCFNLLEEDSRYASGEIRKAVYDALDMLGVEE